MKLTLILLLVLNFSIMGNDVRHVNGLDTKITFSSKGRTVKDQLEDLKQKGNIEISVNESFGDYLNSKTIKFTYVNTKIKYILRRLLNDIDLSYRVIGDIITVLK